MIKVDCESCKAPYDLDERRLPPNGMKMRCPKCGSSFHVNRDGTTAPVEAGATGATVGGTVAGKAAPAVTPPKAAVPAPPPASDKSVRKATMLGMPTLSDNSETDLPKPKPAAPGMPAGAWGAAKKTDKPAAPQAAGAFSAPPKAPPPAAFSAPPKAPPPPAAFSAPPKPPAAAPAPPVAAPAFRAATPSDFGVADDEVDLPAPRIEKAASPLGVKAATLVGNPSATDAAFDELDLPAPNMQAAGFGDVDLPAPAKAKANVGFGDVDLPAPATAKKAPAGFGDIDLPAPATAKANVGFGDVDLPAPAAAKKAPAGFGDIDLPAPATAKANVGFGDVDLPAPAAAKKGGLGFGEVDLPAPLSKTGPAGFGDADLPAPAQKKGAVGFGEVDLPVPARAKSSGDEASFGDIDLDDSPSAKAGAKAKAGSGFNDEASFQDIGLDDLPAPKALADLPAPKGRADLPAVKAASADASEMSFADLQLDDVPGSKPLDADLPVARGGAADLPQPKRFDAPTSAGSGRAAPSASPASRLSDDSIPDFNVGRPARKPSGDVGGEMDLGAGDGATGAEDGYGEVDIGASAPAAQSSGPEEMEFGLPPRDDEAAISLPEDILRRQRGEKAPAEPSTGNRGLRLLIQLGVVLGVITLVGAGLSLTNYGFFGMYYLERYLPAAGDPKAVAAAISRAEKTASSDTYEEVRRSLAILGRERQRAGINRELLTRSVAHEALYTLRFGPDAASAARSAAIMSRLEERRFDAPGMDLAFAGDFARRGELQRMLPHIASARAQAPKDPYVELMAGELALRLEKPQDAQKAFARAKELGAGARAEWGLARVALLGTDVAAQDAAVEATLKLSPLHVGGRIGKARVLVARNQEQEALALLEQAVGIAPVDGKFLWSSGAEKADGFSVLGYVHEVRGRLHLARKAYADALAGDPFRLEALLGAGRVLLRERRYADGLTRFESALKVAEKKDITVLGGRRASVEAKLGIGRALLLTARPQDAREKLAALVAEQPKDAEIVLWLGKVDQDLGKADLAEVAYRKSIELAPERFDGYLALSQLFFNEGKNEEGSIVLKDAAKKVTETAEMRRMLGQSELKRNQLESAITEFQRALTLDPGDMDALFGMGVAMRRHGRLEVAEEIFNRLARQDPSYAGLPLERGLLFEARGNYDSAAKSYQEALKQDPENSNLLLRLGAAEVALGDIDAAERTLEIVIKAMPNSAEAEYFIGRVAFGRGQVAEAMTHFDRAVSLDGTVGEYHLYVGWAAMDMGNLGRTLEEIQAAIDTDPSLGDAYWLRGVVRLRTGAVQDALRDVLHALELKPSRMEALAVAGDCYDQLRMLDRAIDSYEKALRGDGKRGHWWYRLGRLQLDAGHQGEAARALENATRIGDDESRTPAWLADAHRMRGEALEGTGNQRGAITHYKRFLELAPDSAIDRRDVTKKLERWGVEVKSDRIF